MRKALFIIIISFLSCNLLFANEMANEVSRYEMALELAGKLAELENNAGCFSRQQLIDLEKKCVEFSDELTKLGINVSSLEKDLADVKEDIAALKLDVDAVKSTEKEKFKINGTYIFQNKNVVFKRADKKTIHNSNMSLTLDGSTKIDENIEMFARWRMLNSEQLTGNNMKIDKVKSAELKFNNAFDSDGLLRIGRSFIRHGSAFILKTEMDGINYSKNNGDSKIEFGMYFQKQIDRATHPICNVYFERNKNNKRYYFDLFYNSYEDGVYNVVYSKSTDLKKRSVKDCKVLVFNAGLLGQFGEEKEFEYLVDGVVTRLHDDNQLEKNQVGYAGHASLRYAPKNSDWGGLIAYNFLTYDCYEELGTSIRNNTWEDFDDIDFDDKYWDYGHKLLFPNTQNVRFLLSYRPKDYSKHKLEISCDYITALDTNKPYAHFSEEDNEPYRGIRYKNVLYGLEYSYKVSENTDFVMLYEKQIDKTWDGYYDSYKFVLSLISGF